MSDGSKNHFTRVCVLWGCVYGALWSLAPGVLSELLRHPGEAATVVLSGMLTGIGVTFGLATLLPRCRRPLVWLLGALSLPLGAGLFGIVISWVHWIVMKLTGTHYRFVMEIVEPPGYVFGPLQAARDYALCSTVSAFALLFIPLAVLTTLHLRGQIRRLNQPAQP